MTYQETVDFLYSQLPFYQNQGKKAFKKDLTNIRKLCNALGNPQETFRSIHVAGTNGKGSVSNYLASYLQHNNYTVGLYTSPHLIDLRERIKINGQDVSKQFIIDFVKTNESIILKIEPSFFEITVAMAFVAFAKKKVDFAVIETGLGGRLDSTNIITPILSIITNIGLDHTDMLGDTLEKIAIEKGGIIKKNIPIIIGEKNIETDVVFQKLSHQLNAPLSFAEDNNIIKNQDSYPTFVLNNMRTTNTAIKVLSNSFVFNHPSFNFPELAKQYSNFRGRWDILQNHPKVIADTGHNEHAFKQTINNLKNEQYEKLHFVFGAVADKDIDSILSLLPKDAVYYFCKPDIQRALDTKTLLSKALNHSLSGIVLDSAKEAYRAAQKAAGNKDLIFVGGSTFIVGEVIELYA